MKVTRTRTHRKIAAVIAAAVAATVFTMYETSGNSDAGPPVQVQAAPAQPVDPAAVLASMHVPTDGRISGPIDTEGDQYASGSFADGEQVTVYTYTYTSAQAMAADAEYFKIPGPGNADRVLLGSRFIVVVTGVGSAFPENPATLAKESGTTLD